MSEDLERRVRAAFHAAPLPPAPEALRVRLARLPVDGGSSPAVRRGSIGRRFALFAGFVLIGVLAVLGLSALFSGARPTPTPTPSAAPTATVAPPSDRPSPSPRTSGPVVSQAGTFSPTGIWVVSGDSLLISADGGITWAAGTVPKSATVSEPPNTVPDVLDSQHVWALTADESGTGVSGDITRDKLALTVHRSTDGGRTWADIPIDGNFPGSLQALHFVDSEHGYLLITPGRFDVVSSTLLRTTDGGLTWKVAGTDGWLGTELATPDASTIWAASAGDAGPVERRIFAVSRDGGRTWQDVPLPGVPHAIGQWASFLQPPIFMGLPRGVFIGSPRGVALVAHNDGTGIADIDLSDDSGKSWTRVSTTTANSLAVLSYTSWLRLGSEPGTIDATNDAGQTWQPLSVAGLPASQITWIGFADRDHGAVLVAAADATSAGSLYVTADGGRTWHAADLTSASLPSPTPQATATALATISSVAFFDVADGLVVGATPGGKGAVWRTADGGRTWAETTLGMPGLVSVAVAGSSTAWATVRCADTESVAPACSMISSSDGGRTWHPVSDQGLGGISFVDARHGWGVSPSGGPSLGGVVGGVLSTTDGGRTWKALPASPCRTVGWVVAVSFVSQDHGWVGCAGGGGAGMAPKGVAETLDGGRTWTVRARATPPIAGSPPEIGTIFLDDYLEGISMRPSGVGLAWAGRGGTLRTTDGGRTWTPMSPGGFDAGPIPAGGWAVTDRHWLILLWDPELQATVLYATDDGGGIWRAVSQLRGVP